MTGRSLTVVKHGALVERPDGQIVSLRPSSVSTLAGQKQLNARQVEAAYRFRAYWEILAQAMPNRVDPFTWHERRSHGGLAEPETVTEARRKLRRCKAILGVHGFDLVSRICGEGYHLRDLFLTRRERDTNADMLRIHLLTCACIFETV